MPWDEANPPTSAEGIEAALLRPPARTHPKTGWLWRLHVLLMRGIEVPLKTRITLVMLGHGGDLLGLGDDLCVWTCKADNSGYSVLNPPHGLREQGRKLPSDIVSGLLAEYPDEIRAAVDVQCPETPEEDDATNAWISGQSAAFAWVHDLKVLKALRDYGVDFGSMRDYYGCNLLHHCCNVHASVQDPAVIKVICEGIQPPRDLHSLLAERSTDLPKLTPAEHALMLYTGNVWEVAEAILSLPGALKGISWRNFSIRESALLERRNVRALLLDRLQQVDDAQCRAAELMVQEQILVHCRGGAVHLPLQLVESCETLKAELERWQPATSDCGYRGVICSSSSRSGGGGGGGAGSSAVNRRTRSGCSSDKEGKAGASNDAGSTGSSSEVAVSAPVPPASPTAAAAQRSVSAGETPSGVLRAFVQMHTAPCGERHMVLDSQDIDTLLGLSTFVDKFLFAGRKQLTAACGQAVRDAVAPKQLGERMLEGIQRVAAGDPAGELLLEYLIPLAVEHFEVTGRSEWLFALPRETAQRITSGHVKRLEGSKKRDWYQGHFDESYARKAKKARLFRLPLDPDFTAD